MEDMQLVMGNNCRGREHSGMQWDRAKGYPKKDISTCGSKGRQMR